MVSIPNNFTHLKLVVIHFSAKSEIAPVLSNFLWFLLVFVGVPRRTIDQGADRAFLVTVQSNLRVCVPVKYSLLF